MDLFVLLCYSFNHQIRFNNKHDFNTSFGMNRSCFNDNIKNNLKYFIDKITSNNISFTNLDFTEYDISNLTTNDFVYMDCPYLITTGSYNDGKRGFKGWLETEELQLQDLMLKLISKNIKFALSNVTYHKGKTNDYLIKFISDNNLNINYIENSYANSNYQTFDRNPNSSIEVLITNYK